MFTNRGDENDNEEYPLKVNSELYDKYKDLCKKEGWIVSRQFEECMERN